MDTHGERFQFPVACAPKEKIVAIYMTQAAFLESRGQIREDFETAVMQSVVGAAN